MWFYRCIKDTYMHTITGNDLKTNVVAVLKGQIFGLAEHEKITELPGNDGNNYERVFVSPISQPAKTTETYERYIAKLHKDYQELEIRYMRLYDELEAEKEKNK